MLRKICQLIAGFLCGLLYIEWLPIEFPASITEFFAACILHPFDFFAAAIVFISGFLMNADIMGEGIIGLAKFLLSRKTTLMSLLFCSVFLIEFISLFLIGFWQTVVFFSFSFLYGIISIDFKELNLAKV